MINIQLARNLILLEKFSCRKINLEEVEIKFLWNVFFKHKFNSNPFKFSNEELRFLSKPYNYQDLTVPNFIQVIFSFFGNNFLRNEFQSQNLFSDFKFFVVNFILFIYQSHLFDSEYLCEEILKSLYGVRLITPQKKNNIPAILFSLVYSDDKLKNLDLDSDVDYLIFLGAIYGYKINSLFQFRIGSEKFDQDLIQFMNKVAFNITVSSIQYKITNAMLGFYFYQSKDKFSNLNLNNDKLIEIYNFNLQNFHELFHLDQHSNKFTFKIKEDNVNVIQVSTVAHSKISSIQKGRVNGINIVGFPNSMNGIGEDARMFANAISMANFNFTLIDINNYFSLGAVQKFFKSQTDHLKNFSSLNIDFALLDPVNLFRYYSYLRINSMDLPNRIVAICPWELEKWSINFDYIFDNVDYFFASTNFILNSFSEVFYNKKIFLAPPAVNIRDDLFDNFDIAKIDEPFVFITIFDGLSSIDRKNPVDAVIAFTKAFPKSQKDVSLIIKTHNIDIFSGLLDQLKALVKDDNRIKLINKSMTITSFYKLVKTAHCFVSLHRSEGFGRNIAENMLFNRPVIVSNYSGNTDFCKPDNSFLVDGALIPVENKYSFSEGLKWFNPNIDSAVEKYKSVYQDRKNASIISSKGRDFINKHYSIEAASKRYTKLLENLIY